MQCTAQFTFKNVSFIQIQISNFESYSKILEQELPDMGARLALVVFFLALEISVILFTIHQGVQLLRITQLDLEQPTFKSKRKIAKSEKQHF